MSLTPATDMKLDQIPPEYGEPVTVPLKSGEDDDIQALYGAPSRVMSRASSMREGHVLNPQHVEFWSVEDVCGWLCSLGRRYEIHQKAFHDLGIDGANLIHLNDEELKVDLQIRSSVERRKIVISLRKLLGDIRMDFSPANSAGCTNCTRDRSSTNNSSRSRGSFSTYSNITPRGRSAGHQPSSVRSYSVPLGYEVTHDRLSTIAPDRISAPSAPHSRHGSQSRKGSMDSLAEKTTGEWEARSMQRLFDRSPKHGDRVEKFEPKFAHFPARNIYEHQTITPQIKDPVPVKRRSLRSTSRRRPYSGADYYHRQSSGSISMQSIASGISDIQTDFDDDHYPRKQRLNDEELVRMKEEIFQLKQEKLRLEGENLSLKQENETLTSRKNSESYLFDLRDPSIQPNLDDEGFPLERPEMLSASSLPITSTNVDDHLLERGRRASHTVDSVASETVTVTTNTSSDSSRKTSFSRCYSTSPRIPNSAHFDFQKHSTRMPFSRDRITILNDRRPGWIRISWEIGDGKEKTKWMSTTDFAKRFPPH